MSCAVGFKVALPVYDLGTGLIPSCSVDPVCHCHLHAAGVALPQAALIPASLAVSGLGTYASVHQLVIKLQTKY